MSEKRKLYLSEKPYVAKYYSKHIKDNDRIILTGMIEYKFKYPDIMFSNSPYTELEPQYILEVNKRPEYQHYFHERYINEYWNNGQIKINSLLEEYHYKRIKDHDFDNTKIKEYFKTFDEIVFACDYDYTGLRAFELYFKIYCNLGNDYLLFFSENNIKVSFVKNIHIDDKSIPRAINKKEVFSKSTLAQESISHYLSKDFFEYNYNINSILFFNEIYKIIFKKDAEYSITKNFINILYFMLDKSNLSEHKILKYMEISKIGNPCSRAYILETMDSLGFFFKKEIKCNQNIKGKREIINLSAESISFLKYLHKKTDDPFLTSRLQDDYTNIKYSAFKNKYEKYLYNVFSKQKRMNRKLLHD